MTVGQGGGVRSRRHASRAVGAAVLAVALVNDSFPDTKSAYEIPNTMVGYLPGYG